MTPQQLTASERIALLARMEEDERKLQEEGGFTWQELRDEIEQQTADLLSNNSDICAEKMKG